jgi:hypothetical protein
VAVDGGAGDAELGGDLGDTPGRRQRVALGLGVLVAGGHPPIADSANIHLLRSVLVGRGVMAGQLMPVGW